MQHLYTKTVLAIFHVWKKKLFKYFSTSTFQKTLMQSIFNRIIDQSTHDGYQIVVQQPPTSVSLGTQQQQVQTQNQVSKFHISKSFAFSVR